MASVWSWEKKKKKRLRGRWAVCVCLPPPTSQPVSQPHLQNSATTPPPLSLSFLPSLSLSHTHTQLPPLSVAACLLFHPSIEQQDKNRSNFSPIQSPASRAGSRDVRASASQCLRFQILDGRLSAFGEQSCPFLTISAPSTFLLTPSSHRLRPLLQPDALCCAWCRGQRLLGIQPTVAFDPGSNGHIQPKMGSLFPVMQPHTHTPWTMSSPH